MLLPPSEVDVSHEKYVKKNEVTAQMSLLGAQMGIKWANLRVKWANSGIKLHYANNVWLITIPNDVVCTYVLGIRTCFICIERERIIRFIVKIRNTVKFCYNGPSVTEVHLWQKLFLTPLKSVSLPPILAITDKTDTTDKNGCSLEIRQSGIKGRG